MVNLLSLAVITGVAFGSLLATETSASSQCVQTLPFSQWCHQVYNEAVKPNVRPSESQAAFKFKEEGKKNSKQLLAFWKLDNLWSVWRNITKNTNGKTMNQFNVKERRYFLFPETVLYRCLSRNWNSVQYKMAWSEGKNLNFCGRLVICEEQQDKNQTLLLFSYDSRSSGFESVS